MSLPVFCVSILLPCGKRQRSPIPLLLSSPHLPHAWEESLWGSFLSVHEPLPRKEKRRYNAEHLASKSLSYLFNPIKNNGFLNSWLVSVPLPSNPELGKGKANEESYWWVNSCSLQGGELWEMSEVIKQRFGHQSLWLGLTQGPYSQKEGSQYHSL